MRAEWLGEVKAGIRKVTWKGRLQRQHCSHERASPLCIFRVGSLSKTHPFSTILLTTCCLGMAGKEGRHAAPAAQGSRPAGKGRGPPAISPSHSVAPSLTASVEQHTRHTVRSWGEPGEPDVAGAAGTSPSPTGDRQQTNPSQSLG